MEKKELIAITIFVAGLTLVAYLLGSSITGYIVQTMYCEDGLCKEFCQYSSDCFGEKICCQKNDLGICEEPTNCQQEFQFQPGADFNPENQPTLESPAPIQKRIIFIYSFLAIAFIVAGIILYFSNKKKK